MQPNHAMKQHLREMKRMIRELKTSRHVFFDEQEVEAVIKSLLKSWKSSDFLLLGLMNKLM